MTQDGLVWGEQVRVRGYWYLHAVWAAAIGIFALGKWQGGVLHNVFVFALVGWASMEAMWRFAARHSLAWGPGGVSYRAGFSASAYGWPELTVRGDDRDRDIVELTGRRVRPRPESRTRTTRMFADADDRRRKRAWTLTQSELVSALERCRSAAASHPDPTARPPKLPQVVPRPLGAWLALAVVTALIVWLVARGYLDGLLTAIARSDSGGA